MGKPPALGLGLGVMIVSVFAFIIDGGDCTFLFEGMDRFKAIGCDAKPADGRLFLATDVEPTTIRMGHIWKNIQGTSLLILNLNPVNYCKVSSGSLNTHEADIVE